MLYLKNDKAPVESAKARVFDPERKTIVSANPQAFPDFQNRMRMCGRWMLLADVGALGLSFFGGVLFVLLRQLYRDGVWPSDVMSILTWQSPVVFWTLGLTIILWLDSRGHYRQRLPYWETIGHVLGAASIGFIASGFIEFASHGNGSRLWTAFCWVFFAIFSLTFRALARHHLDCDGKWTIPAILIGEGPTAREALAALSRDKHLGFTIVDHMPPSVLGDMKRTRAWKQILMMHDAHYVFLALEGSDIERYHTALRSLPRARVPCSIIPPWLGLPSSTMTPHHFMMQDVMMLHDTNRLKLPLPSLIKRLVDLTLAGAAVFFLLPVFAVVALIVRRDGGPALFKQARVGKGGKLFQCYKFRSMRVDAEVVFDKYLAENPGAAEEWRKYQKLKNDVRVTDFGRLMRKTSIDELPQLINVLKGDMSLVGPRPCMAGQEDFYAEDFSSYESVRPGITGPWQVSGRNHLTFKQRVDLEAWYARNWSVWLDIVIMLKTIPTLLNRDHAY